jgi:hypothetical protein
LIISAGGVAVGLVAFNGGVQYAFTGSFSVLPDGTVATSLKQDCHTRSDGFWHMERLTNPSTRAITARTEPDFAAPTRGFCFSPRRNLSQQHSIHFSNGKIPYE